MANTTRDEHANHFGQLTNSKHPGNANRICRLDRKKNFHLKKRSRMNGKG